MSERFAALLGSHPTIPAGRHVLKGFAEPVALRATGGPAPRATKARTARR